MNSDEKEIAFEYQDDLTKKVVEDWSNANEISAPEQMCMHLEQLFDANYILIHHAEDQGDALVLNLQTDVFSEAREFLLTAEGSLMWS